MNPNCTAAPAPDSVDTRKESESVDESFVVEDSESMDEVSPPTVSLPTVSPTTGESPLLLSNVYYPI